MVDSGQWMGFVSSLVHTNQLLVWDTLRVFAPISTLRRLMRSDNMDEDLHKEDKMSLKDELKEQQKGLLPQQTDLHGLRTSFRRRSGTWVTCQHWKFTSVEEIFDPILHLKQQQD